MADLPGTRARPPRFRRGVVGPLGAAALSLGLACAAPAPPPPAPPEAAPPVEESVPLDVGIEYVRLEAPDRTERLATLLAPLGVTAAKPWCEQVGWGEMQPRADAGLDFTRVDAFVASFQGAGFRELVLCLDSTSPWASRVVSGHLRTRSPAPRPEHLDAYARWVSALVERYDGDGKGDLPGLVRPVRYYEIGGELTPTRAEPLEHYLATLERAHRAAHAAMDDVVVIHAAILLTRAYEARGDAAGLADDGATRDLRRLLDRPEIFDALNLHALGPPAEIDAAVDWLEAETARRGYAKPLVVSDSATTPFVAWGSATDCRAPATERGLLVGAAVEEDRCRLAAYFRSLVAGHRETLAWTRGFAAADLVKKVLIAADRRARLINLSLVEDLDWWQDPALEAGVGNAAWSGLVDLDARQRRPAYFALQQLMRALRGRDSVKRVPTPRDDVRVYAVEGAAGPVWVAWMEPRLLVLPGEPVPAAIVSFPIGAPRMRIEETVTHPGQQEPAPLEVDTVEGTAWLEVTPTPAFVHPVP